MLVKFSKLQSIFFKFNLSVVLKVGRLCGWVVISYFTLQFYAISLPHKFYSAWAKNC